MSDDMLDLNWLIYDPTSTLAEPPWFQRVWEVSVPKRKRVVALMQRIEEAAAMRLKFSTYELILWKCSIPMEDADTAFQGNPVESDSFYKLPAFDKLSNVFTVPPMEDHIHILVQLVFAGELQMAA